MYRVHNKRTIHKLSYTDPMLGNSGYIGITVLASSFAIVLIVCVAIFTTVVIILVKRKIKDRGLDHELAIRTETTTSTNEHLIHQQSNLAAIDTRRNIVYGHSLSSSTIIDMQSDIYSSVQV